MIWANAIETIRLNPNLAVAWNNKGIAPKLLGRTAQAESALAKAKGSGV
jgi:Flp pilus assembly protein TadD